MKKFIIALLTLVFTLPFAQAQESVTEKLYDKYSGLEGITTVHITKELFSMIAQMNFEGENAEEMNEMKDAMANLQFIRIVMFEDADENDKDFQAFKKDLKAFDLDGFKELMVVDEQLVARGHVHLAREEGDAAKAAIPAPAASLNGCRPPAPPPTRRCCWWRRSPAFRSSPSAPSPTPRTSTCR